MPCYYVSTFGAKFIQYLYNRFHSTPGNRVWNESSNAVPFTESIFVNKYVTKFIILTQIDCGAAWHSPQPNWPRVLYSIVVSKSAQNFADFNLSDAIDHDHSFCGAPDRIRTCIFNSITDKWIEATTGYRGVKLIIAR